MHVVNEERVGKWSVGSSQTPSLRPFRWTGNPLEKKKEKWLLLPENLQTGVAEKIFTILVTSALKSTQIRQITLESVTIREISIY